MLRVVFFISPFNGYRAQSPVDFKSFRAVTLSTYWRKHSALLVFQIIPLFSPIKPTRHTQIMATAKGMEKTGRVTGVVVDVLVEVV